MAKKVVQFLDFESEYDFLLMGIFCAYRDYKLCFELNNALELSFEKLDDFEIALDKKGYNLTYITHKNEINKNVNNNMVTHNHYRKNLVSVMIYY